MRNWSEEIIEVRRERWINISGVKENSGCGQVTVLLQVMKSSSTTHGPQKHASIDTVPKNCLS